MTQNFFKSLIAQYKPVIDARFGIIDDELYVLASSDEKLTNIHLPQLEDLLGDGDDVIIHNNTAYKPVFNKSVLDFIVFIEDTTKEAIRLLNVLSVAFNNLRLFQDEKINKSTFIKHLLQDSILPTDIYAKAKELRIETETNRVVYILKTASENLESVYDILYNMYPSKDSDFIVNMDENAVVLVKEFSSGTSTKDIDSEAYLIKNTVNSEAMCKIVIGVGSLVDSVRDIATSYKNAKIALEVSKVFDTEKDIINYEHLGIGRLIYQLPTTLCKKFLDEVFKKDSIDQLDEDTINTIQKFFENSLNISETARKLFVHRNTLVYRLDKIQKNTGLDLRQFDDAIIFKVAMMVKKYLSANIIKL